MTHIFSNPSDDLENKLIRIEIFQIVITLLTNLFHRNRTVTSLESFRVKDVDGYYY